MTRLNFTGRRRLPQHRVRAALDVNSAPPNLTLSVDLSSYELPGDHQVIVEVYRPATYQTKRVIAGTGQKPPKEFVIDLQDFAEPSAVLARVKVVGAAGADVGKIVLEADSIRPRGGDAPAGRRGLLDIQPTDDLGQRLWRLELGPQGPLLLVNRAVGDWNEYARKPDFAALVYPEVLKDIVHWLLETPPEDPEDPDEPAAQWSRFVRHLGVDLGDVDAQDADARRDASDLAVDQFALRNHLLDKVNAAQVGDV